MKRPFVSAFALCAAVVPCTLIVPRSIAAQSPPAATAPAASGALGTWQEPPKAYCCSPRAPLVAKRPSPKAKPKMSPQPKPPAIHTVAPVMQPDIIAPHGK